MTSGYAKWDKIYHEYPLKSLGWELGRARPILIEFVKKGLIKKGKMLDICCGAGTNSVYLAKNSFSVYAADISPKAIQYAKETARREKVKINLLLQSFINLSFSNEIFDFVFDMGCFHHVQIPDRAAFIKGIRLVLKKNGIYMITCFSHKNGSSWNHFTKIQLKQMFSGYFKFIKIRHYSSIEGDGIKRFFYTVLLKK
ncbi:class I SAM-dependent methyltransferase [Candidatus Bathyarchaeota archaeon]|nr:class I SAM-dependent methyltransferase [Candidatus Bathyarchaeota archaeon]